ncbi:hypothetical protein BGZ46_001856, partial [Entomortierella lignicola]
IQMDSNSIQSTLPSNSDDQVEFYMNNTPYTQPTQPRNTELAGDDDDEDNDNTDNKNNKEKLDTVLDINKDSSSNNSNDSLATVAVVTAISNTVHLEGKTLEACEVNVQAIDCEQSISNKHTTFEAHFPQDQSTKDTSSSSTTSKTTTTTIHSNATALNDKNNESTPIAAISTFSTELPVSPPSPSLPSRSNDIDTSKDILTKGQAFAYVGLCLVTANTFFQALDGTETSHAKESFESFVSKLINRLSKHLEIDSDTQRTIAQLPQMMIQPEDLLESFVADGTQRVVSSQQVDQSDIYSSRPSSPLRSHHSRQDSTASQSSISSLKQQFQQQQQQQSPQEPEVASDDAPQDDILTRSISSNSDHSISSLPREPEVASDDTPQNDILTRSITSNSVQSISSLPRESTSSLCSNNSNGTSNAESSSLESPNKSEKVITDSLSRSSTLINESLAGPRSSTSSQKAITVDLRWTLIADLFLICISDSVYDSRARVLLKAVGTHLGLSWNEIVLFEKGIMKQLQSTTSDGLLKPDTKSRNKESRKKRMIMMGLATVGGGLVLGLSAGLFAPVIGAGIGAALAGAHITGATATAASAFLAGSGGIAVITSGAAVTGSGIAMKKMARRTAGIDTFEFLSIHDNKRVNVILTISGWLDIGEEDASLPFSTLDPINGDQFALLWEPEMLMQLGNAIKLLATEVITLTAQEILKHTLLSALLSALAWPMALTRLGYLIDNPWSIALDRAKLAGLVLADSLLMRSYLGFRPITLVGYSLGARVIFYCLLELGRLDAFGIVEDAYLFGAPITASETQWRQARSAVAGEFINGYLRNDWVLGFLFRATTGGLGTVAGLRPIENVPGLTNMDLTSHVEGHLDYRVKIPILMKLMGLKVTSESFLDKEEAVMYQRSLKINPNEVLKAPKPMMPSKAELAKSGALTENEKLQLEIAFRRPAPKAKIPNLDEIKGLTPEEKEALREALMGAAAAQ